MSNQQNHQIVGAGPLDMQTHCILWINTFCEEKLQNEWHFGPHQQQTRLLYWTLKNISECQSEDSKTLNNFIKSLQLRFVHFYTSRKSPGFVWDIIRGGNHPHTLNVCPKRKAGSTHVKIATAVVMTLEKVRPNERKTTQRCLLKQKRTVWKVIASKNAVEPFFHLGACSAFIKKRSN